MSDCTTDGIRIRVNPRYHPEQSDPAGGFWFFSYSVLIENVGDRPAQLVSRVWVITDATGKQEHVSGLGVVGQQPRLDPGEGFRYTSGCPLPTSMGTMHGQYEMVRDDGERFSADIAPFTLCDPLDLN